MQHGQAEGGRKGLDWRIAASVLAIGAAVGLVFGSTLKYPFLNYDTPQQLEQNPMVRDLSPAGIARMFSHLSLTSYYPVRVLSYALDYHFWKLNPMGYRITNLMLHTLNALLVLFLIRRMLPAEQRARRAPETALAVIVFCVHPVVVEPVVWAAGREELLVLFFSLLCVHMHARAASSPVPGRWIAASVVACIAAGLSNAVGAAVPLLVSAYYLAELAVEVPGPASTLGRVKAVGASVLGRTWPLWLVGAAAIVTKFATKRHDAVLELSPDTILPGIGFDQRLPLIFDLYARNLQTIIFPRNLTLPYPQRLPESLADPHMWIGVLCALGTLALLWAVRGNRLRLFGLLWFLAGFAPSAQVLPHHVFRADRFLYIPMAGLAILIAGLFTPQPQRTAPAAGREERSGVQEGSG